MLEPLCRKQPSLYRFQNNQGEQGQQEGNRSGEIHSSADNQTDGGNKPQRSCSRQPLDRITQPDDRPGTQKTDTRNNLSRNAPRIARAFAHILCRQPYRKQHQER
ncbi:MAG: hypothetical protein BWY39_00030 [Spirochaetes bacterium ADurb.Bin269]|nr:MAG: hypothetical protein BWY39_00030 [Spirochaetes bacterium ADurb.Bin269]